MIESNREIKKPSEKREIMPRFEASALRGYCVSVLTASGVERSCAEAVADALIDAELTGVSTHGVSRLAVYMQRMDAGVMSRENNIRIVRESTSTLVVDAGNSLGAAAAKFAMERCIAKAKETGCCFASVHSSNHFGTAAYYTRLAAAQDMIGFACTNLKGKIAPFGSAEPYMGTNPISVAAPSDDLPASSFWRRSWKSLFPRAGRWIRTADPPRTPRPVVPARSCRSAARKAAASPSWSMCFAAFSAAAPTVRICMTSM